MTPLFRAALVNDPQSRSQCKPMYLRFVGFARKADCDTHARVVVSTRSLSTGIEGHQHDEQSNDRYKFKGDNG